MKFRSESTIAHPRSAVFAAYRDQLADIATYLDDIGSITVVKRSEEGDSVRLHNEWASNREVPGFAKAMLKPEHLRWDDHAVWDANAFTCTFETKTRAFTDAVTCTGTNTFVDDGGSTRVILEGTFELDASKLGIPRFLAGRLAPQMEKFIISLITPNLEHTNVAVGRFLDDAAKGA